MRRIACFLALLFVASFAIAQQPPFTVEVQPDPVYIEHSDGEQLLNFDFVVTNHTAEPVTVGTIQVSVYDRAGKLQARKFVNNNGARPSIETIGSTTFEPNQARLVFNPLFNFDRSLELASLEFEFTWWGKDNDDHIAKAVVHPVEYTAKRLLILPVRGPHLIWDGHDIYSHHRRFDYVLPMIHDFNFRSNVSRYAYDLVKVNENGETHTGDPAKNENWFGFGTPIYAAGEGKVVAVRDSHPDNRHMDMKSLKTDHLEMFGNYVVIEQGTGEYALYGHIHQGSAKVKVGDQVRQGQQIAEMGTAGSSIFPHLHFELQTTADADGQGLPSYFDHYRRVLGSKSVAVKHGQIDTGDIVESEK